MLACWQLAYIYIYIDIYIGVGVHSYTTQMQNWGGERFQMEYSQCLRLWSDFPSFFLPVIAFFWRRLFIGKSTVSDVHWKKCLWGDLLYASHAWMCIGRSVYEGTCCMQVMHGRALGEVFMRGPVVCKSCMDVHWEKCLWGDLLYASHAWTCIGRSVYEGTCCVQGRKKTSIANHLKINFMGGSHFQILAVVCWFTGGTSNISLLTYQ